MLTPGLCEVSQLLLFRRHSYSNILSRICKGRRLELYKHRENCIKLPREHLIVCQGSGFLLKDPSKVFFCHNLRFGIIEVLSQFDILRFYTNWVFEFCHNLSFQFSHNLSFWMSSQFKFLSFITIIVLSFIRIWVFEFHHNLSFEFHHNLSFWVLSQFEIWVSSPFEFLSFITILVFEFYHN